MGVGKLHAFPYRQNLILAGDGIDDADFSDAHPEHPDEILLESANSLEDLQGQNGFSKNGQIPGPQVASDRNVPQMRPPIAQRQYLTNGTAQNPKITSRVTGSNTMMLTKHVEPKLGLIQSQRKAEAISRKQQGQKANKWQPAPAFQASHNTSLDIGGAPRSAPGSPHMRVNSGFADVVPHSTKPTMPLGSAEYERPIGFVTARAAESVQNVSGLPLKAPAFNPHLESPSIRKTAGVDHTKTLPVGKDTVAASLVAMPHWSNFINPQTDKARRVGMPVGTASPTQNRNLYKPPQIKRSGETNMAQYVVPPFLAFLVLQC